MIKNLLLFSTLLLLIQFNCFSQIDIDTKLNLFKASLGQPEIAVEAGSGKISFELNARYLMGKWGGDVSQIDADGNEVIVEEAPKRSGVDLTFRTNIYFRPEYSLDKWRVSPYVRYRTQTLKYAEPLKNNRISAGLMLGRKGFFTERIGYDFDIGFGKSISNSYTNAVTKEKTDFVPSLNGVFAELFNKIDLPVNITILYRFGEGFPK